MRSSRLSSFVRQACLTGLVFVSGSRLAAAVAPADPVSTLRQSPPSAASSPGKDTVAPAAGDSGPPPAPAAPADSAAAPPEAAAALPASDAGDTAAPAEPAAAVAKSSAELAAAIAEIDQQARIANRKLEILEEQLATKGKEVPVVIADGKSFGVRNADSSEILRVRGLLQADARWFLYDGALSDRSDTFLIRRLRPTLEGTLLGTVDYRITPDFAGAAVAVFDAYVDIHPKPWFRLRVGKFKSPLGLERLQSDPDVPLVERALTQYLTPTRDIGGAIWGEVAGGVFTYNLGVFNGAPDNGNLDVDANHAKDFVVRVLLQPLKAEGLNDLGSLGVHFAFSTGNRFGTPANPQLPSFRSAGQNTFFSYLAPGVGSTADPTGSGTPFAHLRQTRLNPGLYYYVDSIGFLAEAVQSTQEVQKGNATTTVTHRAAHATVSLVLGGRNGYDGPTPTTAFDAARGTWGAVELAARWSYLRVSDAAFGNPNDPSALVLADPLRSARRAQAWALALNLVPSRTVKLGATFERTTFVGGLAAADKKTVIDRKPENALLGRVQVNF